MQSDPARLFLRISPAIQCATHAPVLHCLAAIVINPLEPCIPTQQFVHQMLMFLRLSQSAQSVPSSTFLAQNLFRGNVKCPNCNRRPNCAAPLPSNHLGGRKSPILTPKLQTANVQCCVALSHNVVHATITLGGCLSSTPMSSAGPPYHPPAPQPTAAVPMTVAPEPTPEAPSDENTGFATLDRQAFRTTKLTSTGATTVDVRFVSRLGENHRYDCAHDGCETKRWVAAKRVCRAAALETASLKQSMHAIVVLGEMAANASCKPLPRLAIGSSPTAPQTHLSNILRFHELYVKKGHGRVENRKVRYTMVE